ncbi:hypothetical protein Bpro_5006 (plasmid) [Polaromonas sp. JS666]|nr:hypothetical protein Bpro_5006 [Polaromonas sp. JS666]
MKDVNLVYPTCTRGRKTTALLWPSPCDRSLARPPPGPHIAVKCKLQAIRARSSLAAASCTGANRSNPRAPVPRTATPRQSPLRDLKSTTRRALPSWVGALQSTGDGKIVKNEKATRFLKFVLFVAAATISMLWAGFVVSQLWKWFFVPMGWRSMTAVQGTGLYIIGQILNSQRSELMPADWKRWIYAIGVPIAGLIIGWAIKSIA